jgi:hypothetical protein
VPDEERLDSDSHLSIAERGLHLLRPFQRLAGPSGRPTPSPGQHIFLEPDRSGAEPCDRCWEVGPRRVTSRSSFADPEDLCDFGKPDEFQLHGETVGHGADAATYVFMRY